MLGIAVAPSSQDYLAAVDDARAAGMRIFEIPQQWRESGNPTNTQLLRLFNQELPKRGLRVVLTMNPLDTMENQIPDDLRSKRYDDPEFIKRYCRFVDDTLAALPKVQLVSISVGNEVDLLLGNHADRWNQYANFFRQAKAHLKKRRPNVPVGVKFTYNGFKKHPKLVAAIAADCDRVMINYYPIDENKVRPPSLVHRELSGLARAFPGKRIQLTEVGYPDSLSLGSSPELQADFVSKVFAAWDALPQIELVNFVWLNEMTPSAAAQLKRTFGEEASLVYFLTSLGLRTHQGKPKPSFLRLQKEVEARRFR